jgi:hypothetical protein
MNFRWERGVNRMAISVTSVIPNQTIPTGLAAGGLHIYSGVVECVFRGANPDPDGVTRDTLTFNVGRVNFPGLTVPPVASCVVSLASIAYDGVVNNALWAVDQTEVTSFVNVDAGSGTADVQVVAHLAVRSPNGVILRVNYILFYPQ